MTFVPLHVDRTGQCSVEAAVGRAFHLFTPEGERGWVEGWTPEYLHPPDGTLTVGSTFRTHHNAEETLWMVLQYDPAAAEVAYVRITPGSRMGIVNVRCQARTSSTTDVIVRYRLTGLSPEGNTILAALSKAAYGQMLTEWEQKIRGYLSR